MNFKSWKTTVGGLLSGAGMLFAAQYPDQAKHGMFVAALGNMLLGLAARDNNVSSESAGVRDVTPPKLTDVPANPPK